MRLVPSRQPSVLLLVLVVAAPASNATRSFAEPRGRQVAPSQGVATSSAADARAPTPMPEPVEPEAPSSPSDELCKRIGKAAFPAADRPSAAEKAAVALSSREYYYGIGTAVDYVKARHAAFVELESGDGLVFGDAALLMMLYANGFGVARNIDLSIQLACTAGHAPAEVEGRIAHLNGMRRATHPKRFDLCDDITSGFMEGHCAGLAEEQRSVARDRKLRALVAGWPPEHSAAFDKLKAAAEAFWTARSGNEVDLSGTNRAAMMIQEEAALRRSFLEALARLEQGRLPTASTDDYRAADQQLNRVYKEALRKDLSFSTITPDGVRATERSWLLYRDAWVALGAVRYPGVTAEAWKAWLSLVRVRQLKQL